MRESLRKLINRNVQTDRKNLKLWDPAKDRRVCSFYFVDGRPAAENPFPTEKLGYDATKRALLLYHLKRKENLNQLPKWRIILSQKWRKPKIGKDHEKETPKPPYSTIKSYSQSTTEEDTTVDDIDFTQLEESWEESNSALYNFNSSSPKFKSSEQHQIHQISPLYHFKNF